MRSLWERLATELQNIFDTPEEFRVINTMDMVIRVDGKFVRLSQANKIKLAGSTGQVVRVSYGGGCGGNYHLDDNGEEMLDVTSAWGELHGRS